MSRYISYLAFLALSMGSFIGINQNVSKVQSVKNLDQVDPVRLGFQFTQDHNVVRSQLDDLQTIFESLLTVNSRKEPITLNPQNSCGLSSMVGVSDSDVIIHVTVQDTTDQETSIEAEICSVDQDGVAVTGRMIVNLGAQSSSLSQQLINGVGYILSNGNAQEAESLGNRGRKLWGTSKTDTNSPCIAGYKWSNGLRADTYCCHSSGCRQDQGSNQSR